MRELRLEVEGTPMHAELHEARGLCRGGVVLVHGFNSSLAEFGDVPGRLADAGLRAIAFDQRGYGRSGGETGRTSVERALQDIGAAAQALRERTPRLPLGILGHSLGASYAIAAMGRTDLFAAGVAAHPVDRLFDELNAVERLGYHAIGRFAEARMRRGKPAGTIPYKLTYGKLFVSQPAAQQAQRDGFLLGRVSLANYRAALTMSASTWARDVHRPVLVFGSRHDRAVRPAHTRKVFDALSGPKKWVEHEGGHSCFRDVDGAMLGQACVDWFHEHLGGEP